MVPQVLMETLQKKSGLILVNGVRNSQVDRLFIEAIKQLDDIKKLKGALILRQAPEKFQLGTPFLLVQYAELSQTLVQKTLQDCDVLIFEKVMDFEELEWALQLAEEGRVVVLHVGCASMLASLHRIFCLWPERQSQHWIWRFADCLQLMIGQTFVGLNGSETLLAHEIALVGSEVRTWLKNNELICFEKELQKAADRSGLVSLNQSLLQLLIRRRIDVKTAFENSLDPENLDVLMKKVGI